MPTVTELEALSRLVAGELEPDTRAALEATVRSRPDLARAQTALSQLDALAKALPPTLPEADVERLVVSVPRAPPRRTALRARALVAGVALAAGAVGAGLGTFLESPMVLVTSTPVKVGGAPAALATRTRASNGAVLTGMTGGAIADVGTGQVWVPRNSGVSALSRGAARLDFGTALASGEVAVQARSTRVEVEGFVLITLEPPAGLVRVRDEIVPDNEGGSMHAHWLKLGPPTLAAAAASAVTVLVLRGAAVATPSGGTPVVIAQAQRWTEGQPAPTPLPSPEDPRFGSASFALTAGQTSGGTGPLASLGRGELLAMVEGLREEKEALLVEKHQLRRKVEALENGEAQRNYYRLGAEELAQLARRGETRYRLPQLDSTRLKYGNPVREEVRLSAQEEARIAEIYEASYRRLKEGLEALYLEIGGAPNAARELGSLALLNELRSKSLRDDYEFAVRQAANERAGLVAPVSLDRATPLLRAFRLMWQEDDRVISELEALLGAARAEQLLNHPRTHQSDHGFGVGPPR